ncbi:hypothetical protein ACFSYD_17870 [Paracoccus aerius]
MARPQAASRCGGYGAFPAPPALRRGAVGPPHHDKERTVGIIRHRDGRRAPHEAVARGRAFSAVDTPLAFDSHDAAYDYLLRHAEEEPLKGIRGEILEDLSL